MTTRSGKISVSLFLILLLQWGGPPTARASGFSDIQGHWAEASINQLIASQAISGYPDNTFRPENSITRAEFASIVMKAFNFVPKANVVVFFDTYKHWAKDAISNATAYGIVSGYDTVTFGPEDYVTREQMALMIYHACSMEGSFQGKSFTDQASISSWANDAVAAISQKNLMGGYADGSFNPRGLATRAEAATLICNALKEKK
ncbi:MAG: S-layer homology domain-containing protein [Syntrophomonadaceae bacterium]